MDLKALMENKTLFYGVIAGIVAVVVVLIIAICAIAMGSGNKASKDGVPAAPAPKVIQEDISLFTTDKIGLAIEVQALLARQGIKARRVLDGTKSSIVLSAKDKITEDQRDIAILQMVQSGLVDEHVGLEIFDTGDFTSTKEDKRIRLIRAMNGELARLIRKIPPIKNAQVFVSVPEQSLFSKNEKPITATVQIQLDVGERLDNMKIKFKRSVKGIFTKKELSYTVKFYGWTRPVEAGMVRDTFDNLGLTDEFPSFQTLLSGGKSFYHIINQFEIPLRRLKDK